MAPAGTKVKLVLKNMTLGPNDHIMFRDGERDDSPLIAKYADCASGEIRLYSTDRYLLVNFVSDTSEPGNGFKLDYQTVESSKATKWVLHIIVLNLVPRAFSLASSQGKGSPVPELSFLPAAYRGWTRAGKRRVQDNLHAHAQNEPIKNYQVPTTLLASMCRAMPFSARALNENIFFDVDIVIKNI